MPPCSGLAPACRRRMLSAGQGVPIPGKPISNPSPRGDSVTHPPSTTLHGVELRLLLRQQAPLRCQLGCQAPLLQLVLLDGELQLLLLQLLLLPAAQH